MSDKSPFEKGVAYAEQAAAAEAEGDLARAYHFYMLCLQWLDLARKHIASEAAKTHIANAMLPRLQRAEELQAQLARNKAEGAVPAAVVAGTHGQQSHQHQDDDLKTALGGAVLSERPTTRLVDVAGLDDVKQALREAVMVPIQAPQLLEQRADIVPWSGILLYGPPGTGKTHIARAIAGEAGCAFFSVSAADLMNKYVGQSERLVRALFELARAARPAVIFVDEIESIVPARGGDGSESHGHMDRVVTEFLKQMDGLGVDNKGILVLGATNIPWQIDGAALRRFERRIYVPLPEAEARSKMITPQLVEAEATAQQIMDMVSATEGYSGSDIKNVLKEGSMQCLRKVLHATHYCPSAAPQDGYVPCDATAPGAIACTYSGWANKRTLRCPPSVPQDYLDALQTIQSSVKLAGLEKFAAWAKTK